MPTLLQNSNDIESKRFIVNESYECIKCNEKTFILHEASVSHYQYKDDNRCLQEFQTCKKGNK